MYKRQRLGWHVSKVYIGYGGKLNKKTRHNLLRDAQAGVFQALAVQRFSSIFESIGDAVQLISNLNQINTEFFSLADNIHGSQSIGVVTALKKLQSDIVRARIKRGVLIAKLQGSTAVSYTHLDVYKRQHQKRRLQHSRNSSLIVPLLSVNSNNA